MPTRRQILMVAGAGVALVGAGAAWRVLRVPETAQQPWDALATPVADVRLDALRHAILAPNPHNRQPWRLRLAGDDRVELSCDLDRRLAETDPYDRQILIGFGTFIETAAIAASARGQRLEVIPFPAGEPGDRLDARPVALLRFVSDAAIRPDPLAPFIPHRRSTKVAFTDRPVPPALLARLGGDDGATAIAFTTGGGQRDAIRDVMTEAFAREMRLPRTNQESIDLMRIGAREIDASPDGIDLDGPMIEALSATGLISRSALADPASDAFAQGLDQQLGVYGSVPAALWLTTPGNSRSDQLAAGRRYARMNLTATAMGLCVHPTSQSLQEYPEMADLYGRIHAATGAGTRRVQMLTRIGYGPAVPPAPRWPVESHFS